MVALPWVRWIFAGQLSGEKIDILFWKYMAILAFATGVTIVGFALRFRSMGALDPKWLLYKKNQFHNQLLTRIMMLLVLVAWFLRLYRAATYGIFFSGTATESAIWSQSYIFSFLTS